MTPATAPAAAAPAFFVREGSRLVPTELARGPWNPLALHGGPPSGLIASEALRLHPREGARVVRVASEILGPVPVAPLSVQAEVIRPGRSVELLEAVLLAHDKAGGDEGRPVLRARLWRVRTDPGLGVPVPVAPEHEPLPPAEAATPWFGTWGYTGYRDGVEARFSEGSWLEPGPGTVWMRQTVPLVLGEETSPLARVLVVADCGNGVSAELDIAEWMFVNSDLVVHLARDLVGEWVRISARTTLAEDGIGLAESALADARGPLGRGAQSLFVARQG